MVDIARVRRESLRWSLLVALNKTRPYTASETLLLDRVPRHLPGHHSAGAAP